MEQLAYRAFCPDEENPRRCIYQDERRGARLFSTNRYVRAMESNDSEIPPARELIQEPAEKQHPHYPDVYQARDYVPKRLCVEGSRQLTNIAPLRHSRRGCPCRLVKSEHHIKMMCGHDIQPGQVCVAVETEGYGKGHKFDGIHAVRVRLPGDDRRRMKVARCQIVANGGYRLMWDDRERVDFVPQEEISFVGNVVGCYSSSKLSAPLLTLFSN